MGLMYAFDVGGSKVAGASISAEYSVLNYISTPTAAARYRSLIDTMASMVPADARAVGVSVAGRVDTEKGVVDAANIPCLAGHFFAQDLHNTLKKPVILLNDAKAFALAEANLGAGIGHGCVFAIILGTGIGGALVLDRRVYTGASGLAGEWGHGPASAMRSGRPLPSWACGCGQIGCLDVFGGARGLERLHLQNSNRHLTSFEILAAWQSGDKAACATLDLYLDIVGGALAGSVNLLDPSIVIAGGGLSGNVMLMRALEQEMHARILNSGQAPTVVATALGRDSPLIGVALFAEEQIKKLGS